MNEKKSYQIISALFLISVLVILIYSNTLDSSWHFDDSPNILENYYLHINSLSLDTLKKTLFTNVHDPLKMGEKLYRPVPCLTFALNWYFGKNNVYGYHIVNTAIHVFTAFTLFLFILNLFKTPNLKTSISNNPIIISLLASILWATNPIQTQTVTYIVQRMAQLAAFFYILGMYAYIKGRLHKSLKKRTIWFLITFFVYPLAIYSKSNAIMLPLAILLTEVIFFQNLSDKKTLRKVGLISLCIIGFIILFGTIAFLKGDPLSFLNSYSHRSFTFSERLLAEPRVVVFYLSQIFFPAPHRFSIAHDIVLSSSFFYPWSTIPSILFIVFLNLAAIFLLKKKPLLSFAILFFFLNHIIESSVIALEIIFEHRNYLPSFFLFLPVAHLLCHLSLNHEKQKKVISLLSIVLIIFIIACFSISTYIRNKVWLNDITLWSDAIEKAPDNARASNILAIKLAWGKNSNHPKKYDMALELFEASLDKHISSKSMKADILGNMATIHFYHKNNKEKGIELFKEALKTYPTNRKIRKDFANALIVIKDFESAEKHIDTLLELKPENGYYNGLKGHALLWKKDYSDALFYLRKAYHLIPGGAENKMNILLNIAVALSLSGEYESAERILLQAISDDPKNITFYFALIENGLRAKQKDKINAYVKTLLNQFSEKQIKNNLEFLGDNPQLAPISQKDITILLKYTF